MKSFVDYVTESVMSLKDENNARWFKSIKVDDIDKEIQRIKYANYNDRIIKLKVNEKQFIDILEKLGVNKPIVNKADRQGGLSDEYLVFDKYGNCLARLFKHGGLDKFESPKNNYEYVLFDAKSFLMMYETPMTIKREYELNKAKNKKDKESLEDWTNKIFFD